MPVKDPLEARLADLEAQVARIVTVLRGTHDMDGNPIPRPPRRNPELPEHIRTLRRDLALARANAAKEVGKGRDKVNTKAQKQQFILRVQQLEHELLEAELELERRGEQAERKGKAQRRKGRRRNG